MSDRPAAGPDLYRVSEQLGRLNAQLEAIRETQEQNRELQNTRLKEIIASHQGWTRHAAAKFQTLENLVNTNSGKLQVNSDAFGLFRSEVSERLKEMEGPVRDLEHTRRKIITTIGWVGSIVGFIAAIGAPVWSPIANRIGSWIVGN
jgi:hypothetical protein